MLPCIGLTVGVSAPAPPHPPSLLFRFPVVSIAAAGGQVVRLPRPAGPTVTTTMQPPTGPTVPHNVNWVENGKKYKWKYCQFC